MTASFLYALPGNVTLRQEAAVARGLRSLFPEFEFQSREGAFLTGEIMPIKGQIGIRDGSVRDYGSDAS